MRIGKPEGYRRRCPICNELFYPGRSSKGAIKTVQKYCKKKECKATAECLQRGLDPRKEARKFNGKLPKYKVRVNRNGVEWVMHAFGLETFSGSLYK